MKFSSVRLCMVAAVAALAVPSLLSTSASASPFLRSGSAEVSASTAPSVLQVAAGGRHTCAITTDGSPPASPTTPASGSVWCWGANDRGQLGRDDVSQSSAPVLVESVGHVTSISAGGSHTCALTESERVWCWGANGSGQLGDSTTDDRYAAVRTLISGATSLSAGRSHTCALARHGADATGGNEVVTVHVDATGGTYALTFDQVTIRLDWNMSAHAVQKALNKQLSQGTVSVWDTEQLGTYAIAFDGESVRQRDVGAVTVDGTGLQGNTASATATLVADGGWRVLCWGSDGSGQLGRGGIGDADLTLGPPTDEFNGNSITGDEQSGDFFVADSARKRLWQFTGQGQFAHLYENLGFEPGALGTATFPDTGAATMTTHVYVADTTVGAPVVRRYDAARHLPDATGFRPLASTAVLPSGWRCQCAITSMAVEPATGTVFILVHGRAGLVGDTQSPFDKLVRVSSDLTTAVRVVDLHAAFSTMSDTYPVNDLAFGADASGVPVLYALQQYDVPPPAGGSLWKVGVWDTAGGGLTLRSSFSVDPSVRGAGDGSSSRSSCPARVVTDAEQVTTDLFTTPAWSRHVRTGVYGPFARIGPAPGGDVGVVTPYKISDQQQVYVTWKDDKDHAAGYVVADYSLGEGFWTDTSDVDPAAQYGPKLSNALDACVNEFAAGSQGSYGQFVTSYRGNAADGTGLGISPADLAALPDGRLLAVDQADQRIQQFSGLGEPLRQWPGEQFSTVPTPSLALSWTVAKLGSDPVVVSAGDAHTCVATTNPQAGARQPVVCWGSNSSGQLGSVGADARTPFRSPDVTGDRTSFPVIASLDDATALDPNNRHDLLAGAVSAGGDHTCASDGLPWQTPPLPGTLVSCWGEGGDGELVGTPPNDEGVAVSTAQAHTLLEAGGAATCFDDTALSAVTCDGPSATKVLGLSDAGLTSLSAGSRHVCAVVVGVVTCWGDNEWGQLGRSLTDPGSAAAVPVPISPRVRVEPLLSDLGSTIDVVFDDATRGVSAASFAVNLGQVVTTVSCSGPDGSAISCSTGPVRMAHLRPRGGVVAGQTYDVVVDPSGDLTSGGLVVASPDPAPVVHAPSSLEESLLGPAYTWGKVRQSTALGGSVLVESAAGAGATYHFRGSTLTWYTVRGPDQGLAEVSIDGRKPRRFDNSATSEHARVARHFSGLGAGEHTFRVTVLGRAGTLGTGSAVAVDGFGTATSLAKSPSVSTTWGQRSRGTLTYATASGPGSSVSFRFRGTHLTWRTVEGRNQGTADVLVDGVRLRRVDNSGAFAPRSRSITLPAVAAGVHRVVVRVVQAGNPAHHCVSIDGFEVS